jgi:two-component system, NtrC family, sensor histidine kinase HydH
MSNDGFAPGAFSARLETVVQRSDQGTPLAFTASMPGPFFESLKQYVGFDEASSAALREFHPIAQPSFVAIVDDFYAAIEAHPEARAAITGGAAQIERLKQTLIRWLDVLLLGPHDQAYYELRARIGRMHVRISLPQAFMFTAMNRIRVHLLDVMRERLGNDPAATKRVATALHQILDLELAIMLETYREDLLIKNRNAERLATIGQFAASIGHELRNPLAVMESSLFLLRQHLGAEAAASPNVGKHLDRISGEISRANKTIHDLLDLARDRPPRRQRTEVRKLVEAAQHAALLPPPIAVQMTVPADLAVDVDPDQMQQVLVNLFTNAAQAMPSGGHITVTGEATGATGARLRVRDDGPGIAIEARYRIFEALFTTKAKGSGLGLALCRRIVEAHGGSIDLEPSETGASFVITIT